MTVIIEMLFPEIANLHGDNSNIDYLDQSLEDVRIYRTGLNDTPRFVSERVDLVYLGPMTESGQIKAIDRLTPHGIRIAELIESGTHFLFTHNAMEVLGNRISNAEMNYDVPGLGIFDFSTTVNMFGRFTGKVMGTIDAIPQPIVGYKSQFSMVSSAPNVPGFLAADRGIGRNRTTAIEGVRVNNFIGTSLIGPVLVLNPHFTETLLRSIDPTRQPTLALRELAIAAYDARVRDFNDSARWSRTELVVT